MAVTIRRAGDSDRERLASLQLEATSPSSVCDAHCSNALMPHLEKQGRVSCPLRHSNTRLKNSWPSNWETTRRRLMHARCEDKCAPLPCLQHRFGPYRSHYVGMFRVTTLRKSSSRPVEYRSQYSKRLRGSAFPHLSTVSSTYPLRNAQRKSFPRHPASGQDKPKRATEAGINLLES
jgi:hypothetical protein